MNSGIYNVRLFNLVGKFLVIVHFESGGYMKILEKVKIQDLWNRSLIGKHSDHSKKLKNSLKNESLYKSFINNVLYCASKYLKRTFGELT